MMTQAEKDHRKADRLNRKRLAAWQDTNLDLFGPNDAPALLTGDDIAAKRERDRAIGNEALDRVARLEEECNRAADEMREIFAGVKGKYLADLREASITHWQSRNRWGIWEAHLHSIGIHHVTVLPDGTRLEVTHQRPDGMEIYK